MFIKFLSKVQFVGIKENFKQDIFLFTVEINLCTRAMFRHFLLLRGKNLIIFTH